MRKWSRRSGLRRVTVQAIKARICVPFLLFLATGCGSTAADSDSSGEGTLPGSSNPPNIILILADDLGYETLGAYGGTSYQTPNLDLLASSGMRFDSAHANPLCTPSRVKLMTGRYNLRNYVQFGHLPVAETTFAHVLKEAGYRTLIAGKWQLAKNGGQTPEMAGFDEHLAWFVDEKGPRYWDPHVTTNGVSEDHDGAYGPDMFSHYIGDFIKRHQDQPFFVYYPMVLPHTPHVSPPTESSEARVAQETFGTMVEYMDDIVGSIVEKVDEFGLTEETLILFLGDNGTSRSLVSNLGDQVIAGGKGMATDAGTHIPLIVSWPGAISKESVNANLVDLSVIFPTLAEAAQASQFLSDDIDGVSILSELEGRVGNPRGWIYIYYEPKQNDEDTRFAEFVREARFKLYSTGDLFDLDTDILEENPISSDSDNLETEAARVRLAARMNAIRGDESVDLE